jgi:hypothetical protein
MSAKKPNKEYVYLLDPAAEKMAEAETLSKSKDKDLTEEQLGKKNSNEFTVLAQILKSIGNHEGEAVQRMAFEVDPKTYRAGHQGLYISKQGLTPDKVIKRITGPNGNELVCQILQARSNHIASFGRRRTSRFALGYEFHEINKDSIPDDEQEFDKLQNQIDAAKTVFWNCGLSQLADELTPMNFSQCLKMITRDGLAYGRFAVEILWKMDSTTGKNKPHSFRPVDTGTIFRILPYSEKDQTARTKALALLSKIKQERFSVEKYKQDKYAWVQVIDGEIVQAFSSEELLVYNLYPVTNVEYNQYPLSPIDQALNAITTNINITLYNKLYFQNGRAAKGAWVFQSDDIDEKLVQQIRNQHTQSINSVTNAHRVPVFGVGQEEKLTWQPVDSNAKDAEFQYLMDQNSRIVLSAFQMSPEELPGYAHLSKGTNSQSLSESNNEYQLESARDVGLRPLLYDMQDFFNAHIFSLFFPELAKIYQIAFSGLDHDSPEKEATRLQQDMNVHMTYDEILEQVEKDKLGEELGGMFPLNPQFQQVLQSYLTFGEVLENFFGKKGAASDPRYMFYMNPMWMQWQQMTIQKAQMAMQNQMMAMQQAQQPDGTQAPGQEAGGSPEEQAQKSESYKQSLTKYHQDSFESLNKAIKTNHDSINKQILARHSEINKKQLKEFKDHSKATLDKIKSSLKLEDKKKVKK